MLTHNGCLAYRGAVYVPDDESPELFRKLECYLPSAEGTYGEPVADTFKRTADQLMAGTLSKAFADGLRYALHKDKLVAVKRETRA